MKKFQVMMLMMLVAFMGLSVQSCGSDDDDTDAVQNFTLKVALQDAGNLDPASATYMETILPNYTQTVRCTKAQAKLALDQAIQENQTSIPVADAEGNYMNYTLKFYLVDDSNKEVYSKLLIIKDGQRTIK